MKRRPRWFVGGVGVLALTMLTTSVRGQAGAGGGGADSLEAINADYLRDLTALELKRMQRLEKVAETAKGEDALVAAVSYFQTALTSGLYRDAEAFAERILKSGHPETQVLYLAEVSNMLAEVDRGAYDEALTSLARALDAGNAGDGAAVAKVLPRETKLTLMETFYQKLVQANQVEAAKKAFGLFAEKAVDAAVKEFAADRLARLDRVGKQAPTLSGADVDGTNVSLAELKGKTVLVVFWATWCLPSAQELEMLDQVATSYKDQGFRVLGVNVDALQEGSGGRDAVLGAVRRYLVEHNVRYPSLVNGEGALDYAKAFGVREIPANFLIDKDGVIRHVDVTAANIDAAVKAALAVK